MKDKKQELSALLDRWKDLIFILKDVYDSCYKGVKNLKPEPNNLYSVIIPYIGNTWLTALYSHWDEDIREEIARILNKDKNEISVPIFGDLRRLRQDIVHKQAKISNSIKCKLIPLKDKKGNDFYIQPTGVAFICDKIREWIEEFKNENCK